jgi:hypothetical protein
MYYIMRGNNLIAKSRELPTEEYLSELADEGIDSLEVVEGTLVKEVFPTHVSEKIHILVGNGAIYVAIKERQLTYLSIVGNEGRLEIIGDNITGVPNDTPDEVVEQFLKI